MEIPQTLRRWFAVHAAVDLALAIPLLVAPTTFLRALGWSPIDAVAARLVGAALLAIGAQSFLGRNDGAESFRVMLNLKLVWSASAIAGLLVSVGQGAPPAAWAALSAFIAFFGVWFHYRVRMKQLAAARDEDLPSDLGDGEDPPAGEGEPADSAS
jgi:hypothetical protein